MGHGRQQLRKPGQATFQRFVRLFQRLYLLIGGFDITLHSFLFLDVRLALPDKAPLVCDDTGDLGYTLLSGTLLLLAGLLLGAYLFRQHLDPSIDSGQFEVGIA